MVQICPTITLQFGGLPIRIRCTSAEFISQISKDFFPWQTDNMSHICITIFLRPISKLPSEQPKVRCFRRRNHTLITHSGIRILHKHGTGDIFFHIASSSVVLFSRAMRILLSFILPKHDALLVHSSAAIIPINNTGLLFLGQSGAGKTTISKLLKAEDCQISNDELSIIRRTSEGWKLFPSPFGGDFKAGCSFHAPVSLEVLHTLVKAVRSDIISLSPPVAFVSVMRCIVNFSQDEAQQNVLFELTHQLVNEVPSSAFYFRKDEKILAILSNKREAA